MTQFLRKHTVTVWTAGAVGAWLGFAGFPLVPIPAGGEAVQAAEPAQYAEEIKDLAGLSDAVILGSIERQEIGISETIAGVRVLKSFKGPLREGQLIPFRTRSGRVKVEPNEPDLTGIHQAVFYLSSAQPIGGPFRCVNDTYGFKSVINDHVYTNPQNPIETVRLKKYLQSLALMAAAPKKTPSPDPGNTPKAGR